MVPVIHHAPAPAPAPAKTKSTKKKTCSPSSPTVTKKDEKNYLTTASSSPKKSKEEWKPSKIEWKSKRYKTCLCEHFETLGTCPFGDGCHFAHGAYELRSKSPSSPSSPSGDLLHLQSTDHEQEPRLTKNVATFLPSNSASGAATVEADSVLHAAAAEEYQHAAGGVASAGDPGVWMALAEMTVSSVQKLPDSPISTATSVAASTINVARCVKPLVRNGESPIFEGAVSPPPSPSVPPQQQRQQQQQDQVRISLGYTGIWWCACEISGSATKNNQQSVQLCQANDDVNIACCRCGASKPKPPVACLGNGGRIALQYHNSPVTAVVNVE
jgi:hypothetical protein